MSIFFILLTFDWTACNPIIKITKIAVNRQKLLCQMERGILIRSIVFTNTLFPPRYLSFTRYLSAILSVLHFSNPQTKKDSLIDFKTMK